MEPEKIIIGITHGDANGIGYEVILKAFENPAMLEVCTPVLYGSLKVLSYYRKQLGIQSIPHYVTESAEHLKHGVINVINVVGEEFQPEPGKQTREAGVAALKALEAATADLREGRINCLVTAPINKENIQSEDFAFPGHTEYLQATVGGRALMVLADADSNLRVALVTGHLPLKEVSSALSRELIEQKISDFSQALTANFGVHSPRIAVLSLNPHSGDGGLLGTEEQEIILPAIEAARANKLLAYGPYAADGFFGAGQQCHFDGVLAMYHDQGLTPFKTLCGTTGVNLTAGLDFVRTSPDHGTAFDIAGKGEASSTSMLNAIFMAIECLRYRRLYAEATSNPLKKLYQERPASRDER